MALQCLRAVDHVQKFAVGVAGQRAGGFAERRLLQHTVEEPLPRVRHLPPGLARPVAFRRRGASRRLAHVQPCVLTVRGDQTFGVRREHDRPDVLADVVAIEEEGALARAGVSRVLARERDLVQACAADVRRDELGRGIHDRDGSGDEIAVPLCPRPLGDERREHAWQRKSPPRVRNP